MSVRSYLLLESHSGNLVTPSCPVLSSSKNQTRLLPSLKAPLLTEPTAYCLPPPSASIPRLRGALPTRLPMTVSMCLLQECAPALVTAAMAQH